MNSEQELVGADGTATGPSLTTRDWVATPRPVRRRMLAGAAERLHERWRAGDRLPFPTLRELLAPTDIEPGFSSDTARPRRLSHTAIRDRLASVLSSADWLSGGECRVFVRRFLQLEGADPAWARPLVQEWQDLDAAVRSRMILRVYRRALRSFDHRAADSDLDVRCAWAPDPAGAARLPAWLRAAEDDPAIHVLKATAGVRVFRAAIGGHDALVKRYDMTGSRRWTYLLRPSRAARAWASARALRVAGIETPEPLGMTELRRGGWPWRSYYVCRFEEGAPDLRKWAEDTWSGWSAGRRRAVRGELAQFLLRFYRHGIHHPDTKASNILVVNPGDDAARRLTIVDLECVACRPLRGRRDIVRNLVQLNGALAHVVPRPERCRFLRELQPELPWVGRPRVKAEIERWTERRLGNERRGRCGF